MHILWRIVVLYPLFILAWVALGGAGAIEMSVSAVLAVVGGVAWYKLGRRSWWSSS